MLNHGGETFKQSMNKYLESICFLFIYNGKKKKL